MCNRQLKRLYRLKKPGLISRTWRLSFDLKRDYPSRLLGVGRASSHVWLFKNESQTLPVYFLPAYGRSILTTPSIADEKRTMDTASSAYAKLRGTK